jgi:putative endonuclease
MLRSKFEELEELEGRCPMPRPRQFYVYILTNKSCTTLYTGVTNDIVRRLAEHRESVDDGAFTTRYKTHRLVYLEEHPRALDAIAREKSVKLMSRRRKRRMIEEQNPEWRDLAADW